MTVYLTTELETQNPYWLNGAANKALSPVRYFFGGRCVQVLDNAVFPFELEDSKRSYLKTAAMIACFIPCLIFGVVARALSFVIEEVRRGFTLVQNAPLAEPVPVPRPVAPVDKGLLPIESVIDRNIAFFSEMLTVPDDKLKAWLEARQHDPAYTDPFYGASVIEESRISFDDMDSEALTKLADCFKLAVDRLQRLGLGGVTSASIMTKSAAPMVTTEATQASAVQKPQNAPSQPQVPNVLTKGLLELFRKAKASMSEKEFETVCKQFAQDPKAIIQKLAKQDQEILAKKQEAAHAKHVRDAVLFSIDFFIELCGVQEDKAVMLAWLEAKKAAKGYPFPFYVGANLITYAKYLGKQDLVQLYRTHKEASEKITRLKLEEYLNESHLKPSEQ